MSVYSPNICLECSTYWPLETSMRMIVHHIGEGLYRSKGPFCPDNNCSEKFEEKRPEWWAEN